MVEVEVGCSLFNICCDKMICYVNTDLHVVVSVEGFETNRTRELCRSNENLRRGRDPVLSLVEPVGQEP